MIQAIKNLFRKKPAVLTAGDHPIKPADISAEALYVVKTLQSKGYTAYIVGGAVRDILLGFRPKDFDIGTDATPQEVKAIFQRKARLIGRRFPIVHVYPPRPRQQRPQRPSRQQWLQWRRDFLDNYIEVTTFRGKSSDIDSRHYYGSAYEDAKRRDFTVNALLYDPVQRTLYDYVGGMADIKSKHLRVIGAAHKRLPEDPVRCLRALRLSVKLGLFMHAALEKHIAKCAPLLREPSGERLYNEFIKAVNSGTGTRIFESWRKFGVCDYVLPVLKADNPMFFSVMAGNDRRVAEGRENSVSFIIAAMFWNSTAAAWQMLRRQGASPMQAMQEALAQAHFRENKIIPQRLITRAKDMYYMQAQLENTPTPRRAEALVHNELFERALAFAAARQEESAAQTASWWAQFARGSAEERELLLSNIPRMARRNRSRGRRRGRGGAKQRPTS